MATVTLRPFGLYAGTTVETVALVALLVCLIPTTIGGLLSAIGIAGMDRVARFNVLAMSGRAVEASGDVDVILLDKTGTITYGNRLAASITRGPGRHRGGGGRGRARRLDPGRDARGPLDRRAGPQATDRARPAGRRRRRRRLRRARRDASPRRSPFRAETRTSGVTTTAGVDHPQGRGRRDREEGRHACRPTSPPTPTGSPTWARPRSSSRARAASSASSSSRTPSRRASSSGSPSSAGWASGP